MHFCDLTLSYTETSGGIRTYIDQKRRYLLEHTDHRHTLIIPGPEDSVEKTRRTTTVRIASPILPGAAPYRFFWRPDKIKAALLDARPDVVELANFYVCPWAAFSYQKELEDKNQYALVGGFFHTDIADAYVGAPLHNAVHQTLGRWSEGLAALGHKLGEVAEERAEAYVQHVFERCDVRMAASENQTQRLAEYGIADAHVVPLGVDLKRFRPDRRSEAVRAEYEAAADQPLLVYAGRLDAEKHVHTLLDLYERLPPSLGAVLVIRGEGALREELTERAQTLSGRVRVLPYETDPDAFADLLASADVYVTAGPHETFGLSVIEAQASGLPVVGVRAGALVERVPEGLGFLAEVDDAPALAAFVEKAWTEREALGQAARAHVTARFGWDQSFSQWLRLYEGHPLRQTRCFPSNVASPLDLS